MEIKKERIFGIKKIDTINRNKHTIMKQMFKYEEEAMEKCIKLNKQQLEKAKHEKTIVYWKFETSIFEPIS